MTESGDTATLASIAVFAIVLALVLIGGARLGGIKRPRSFSRRWEGKRGNFAQLQLVAGQGSIAAATDQLRIVMGASYRPKKVISFTEAKVMAAAERAVAEAGQKWRVLAQVSLGEVLASDDKDAFHAINAKRVDLLIMSEQRDPLAVIEYQGEGHHQGTAAARDAVKKEALRRAGIKYIEITCDHGEADVRREIGQLAFTLTRDSQETMRKVTGA